MDETSDEILEHIETQRNQLGTNLNELETRVRHSTDWRTYFEHNPMLILAGALGGGILLGAMVGGSKSSVSSSRYISSQHHRSTGTSSSVNSGAATYFQKQRASETLDNIKAAVVAFATAKAREFLNEAIPGLDSYMRDAQSSKSASHFSPAGEYTHRDDQKEGASSAFGDYGQRTAPQDNG